MWTERSNVQWLVSERVSAAVARSAVIELGPCSMWTLPSRSTVSVRKLTVNTSALTCKSPCSTSFCAACVNAGAELNNRNARIVSARIGLEGAGNCMGEKLVILQIRAKAGRVHSVGTKLKGSGCMYAVGDLLLSI